MPTAYTSTAITRANISNAVINTIDFTFYFYDIPKDTAYVDIYKCILDFDDIDYIHVLFENESDVVYLLCEIGGVQQFEVHPNGAKDYQIVDCTGISGSKALNLQVKNTDAANPHWIQDLHMWSVDA